MSGQDLNNEIEELRERLRSDEIKIQELEQQLQEDRDSSTKKIKELQDEKKRLENEVSELKEKIKRLEEAKKKDFADLLDRMDKMEKRSREQDEELKSCREEISYFSKKSETNESKLKVYMARTESLEKSRKILNIGQLCAILMEAVYWLVLPDYFERSEYNQPHLKYIDQNIEKFSITKEEKREAQKKWRELKAKFGDDLIMFMEEKWDQRHEEAHPFPLNENELKEIARDLPGQEQQKLEKVIRLSKELTPEIFITV